MKKVAKSGAPLRGLKNKSPETWLGRMFLTKFEVRKWYPNGMKPFRVNPVQRRLQPGDSREP
jgi:hypothetical protein